MPHRSLLIAIALLALALPAGATETYLATIDGNQAIPPNHSSCVGHGTFVLLDDLTTLTYEIHFDPWVNDEFISHIHLKYAPPTPGETILVEIAPGPDKVGEVTLESTDVDALREGRLFVNVHTISYMQGEVRGWILPSTAARPSTWGSLKAQYR
jgi:hypothetical protein